MTAVAGSAEARRRRARACVRGLYGMVDVTCSPGRTHVELAEALLAGGCTVLQVRAKGLEDGALLALARAVAPRAERAGALLVVNDRLAVARAVPGCGLHIGEEDGDPEEARAALPPDRVLGLSTHDRAEAARAASVGADYIGFGPVYSGATKGSTRAPRGAAGLAEAVRATSVPVVAIGGVTLERLPEVVASGAAAAASISDVSGAEDVAARALAWGRVFAAVVR